MKDPAGIQAISLHREAPPKAPFGNTCTRCGVCCAAEPCPAGQLLFLQRRGTCPALTWDGSVYNCGLVTMPHRFIGWLPDRWRNVASRAFHRWIAAGTGCDSTVEVRYGYCESFSESSSDTPKDLSTGAKT